MNILPGIIGIGRDHRKEHAPEMPRKHFPTQEQALGGMLISPASQELVADTEEKTGKKRKGLILIG